MKTKRKVTKEQVIKWRKQKELKQKRKENEEEPPKREYKHSSRTYPATPTSTLRSMMGEQRWSVIDEAIRTEYGTGIIIVEHREIPQIRIGSSSGKLLGTVAQVEKWAKKYMKGKKK